MPSKYAERYVLRSCSEGGYLGVNAVDQRIESQPSLDRAWIFHSHDGAVRHALSIGEVHGETPDVVKLDE
ncbi:hypothetical protein Syncc8109_2032 [Synechococcus sp. WH 8109]|uniref:hypothetical protein n=1 Tax=Synechococcus sp. WH 8109 TaxID=166314 RepID=UPI0001B8DA97|nr:hypothetical protein [Synechococcus sp. WH 8109]AHF64373.1 hypothetical protein Syncc8109_2032 [Synechococcus sp. WH 8109]